MAKNSIFLGWNGIAMLNLPMSMWSNKWEDGERVNGKERIYKPQK